MSTMNLYNACDLMDYSLQAIYLDGGVLTGGTIRPVDENEEYLQAKAARYARQDTVYRVKTTILGLALIACAILLLWT